MRAKGDLTTAPADSDGARAVGPPQMPGDVEEEREAGREDTGAAGCEEPSGEGQRPLLLVDIDGVISLFPFDPREQRGGSFHTIEGIPHFLSATAAGHLLGLAEHYDLVWASGWEEKANEHLPHLLGLPRLQHLSFERRVGKANAHWKLDAIEAHAGERPLAWIDDAFNDACHEWADARPAPTLLVQTEPSAGLTQREADRLTDWAKTVR